MTFSAFIQLVKEFWLPFLLASCWTIFSLKSNDGSPLTTADTIANFGACFFFTSWLLAQFFRVKNQQKVHSGLSEIEVKVMNLDRAISRRVEIEASHAEEMRLRRISEGAPKFYSYKNSNLGNGFFRGSEEPQMQYFSDFFNKGRTVYNVKVKIVGSAVLQKIEKEGQGQFLFTSPVWAAESGARIIWTYPRELSESKMLLTYDDVFGEEKQTIFSILPTDIVDESGAREIAIFEVKEDGDYIAHSGEPDFDYNYDLAEVRRHNLDQLEESQIKQFRKER